MLKIDLLNICLFGIKRKIKRRIRRRMYEMDMNVYIYILLYEINNMIKDNII